MEIRVIYFLTQTFGSVLILFHLVFWKENLHLSFRVSPLLLILGLILKIGLVPIHQWFLIVGRKIKKSPLFVLITLQKIIPLFLFKSFFKIRLIPRVTLLRVFFGVFFQMGVSNIKKLLLYSSIVNMGWLIILSSFNLSFLIVSFSTYFIILLSLVPFISKMSIETVLGFISLAGIPPLLGFFIKLIALKVFVIWGEGWVLFLLVLRVINVFVYFRVFRRLRLKTPSPIFYFLHPFLQKATLFLQIVLSILVLTI